MRLVAVVFILLLACVNCHAPADAQVVSNNNPEYATPPIPDLPPSIVESATPPILTIPPPPPPKPRN
jgi:hypothetical protein